LVPQGDEFWEQCRDSREIASKSPHDVAQAHGPKIRPNLGASCRRLNHRSLCLPNEDFGRMNETFEESFRITFPGYEYSIWLLAHLLDERVVYYHTLCEKNGLNAIHLSIMLARNITSCLLLHIILNTCSMSERSCLIEIIRIVCHTTWAKLRLRSHVKIVMLPIMMSILRLCTPREHGLCVKLSDNVMTFTAPNNLNVACNSPLLLVNGSNCITLQMNVKHVRLNCMNIPEAFWVRIFTYYMPKTMTLGRLVLCVKVVKVSKRTMQLRLVGDVSKWVGAAPCSAYVRFTPSTFEFFAIPDIF
jgi:hypothetical protein